MSQLVVLVAPPSVNKPAEVYSPLVLGLAVVLGVSEPFGPEKTVKTIAGPQNMARPPHIQSMFCNLVIMLFGTPVVV